MPQISVIVPVYQAEAYLDSCVQSILSQTFTDWELILVDDGSPDQSGAMCDAYVCRDSRIQVLHQTNQGQAAARTVYRTAQRAVEQAGQGFDGAQRETFYHVLGLIADHLHTICKEGLQPEEKEKL